ncbi:Thiol-disulfide isomerase and thioredoxin [Minicystis rosea]|nr:Thiol-disulfide isomerase and thioredoxin [Minicystis rosea]
MKTQAIPKPLAMSLAAALIFAARPAGAQQNLVKVAQASDFFDAGAEAYKTGQYLIAAEAFLKAHEISPSPALLFSAAQSYRRQFLAEPAPLPLHRAISLYREYLRNDKAPKRREDAMQALAALAPFEARYGGPEGAAEAAEPKKRAATRLLLSTPADDAQVSVDGGPFVAAPFVAQVPPGPHQVRVRAPGYEEEIFTAQALEGELVPRHVALRPRPAHLVVTGTSGARVAIDGQLRATLPLAAPIAIEPGAHFVSVTMTGHQPFGAVVELPRDGSTQLVADLRSTRQRVAAWTTLAIGAAGAVTAGVLGGVALSRQGEASSLEEKRGTTPLLPAERDQYNSALKARDGFASAAAIAGGVSVVALAAGAGLFAIDKPEVVPPNDERLRAPTRLGPKVDFEVGLLSIGVRGVF